MKYFAISDVHGQFKKFEELLHFWNPDNEQLVLLGDYIDRGPDSLSVLKLIHYLEKHYGAIVLRGNHEDLFLTWFNEPDDPDDYYFHHLGLYTMISFINDAKQNRKTRPPKNLSSRVVRDYIRDTYPEIIELMNNTKLYYETSYYIFVHAGFNTNLRDWKNSTEKDLLWIRNEFIFRKNETGKIAVFGHTNTFLLHNNTNNDGIWIDSWGSKIGIDGGAGSGRHLNGVVLSPDGDLTKIKVHQI